MEVRRLHPDVLGSAVFGTLDGLQSVGSGVLTQVPALTGIFEFGLGRSRKGLLHGPASQDTLVFRRQCVLDGRETIEILGYLGSCRDQQDRPGYFGACIACSSDSRDAVYDWEVLYDHAAHVFKAQRSLLRDERLQRLPREHLLDAVEDDAPTDLKLAAHSEMCLVLHPSFDLGEAIRRMQATAFIRGSSASTLILSEVQFAGARQIASPEFQSDIDEMERILVEHAQRLSEGGRPRGQKPPRPIFQTPAPHKAQTSTSNMQDQSKGERIRDLETRVQLLERSIDEIHDVLGRSRRGDAAYASSARNFSGVSLFEDPQPSGIRKLLPWIAGGGIAAAVAVLLLVSLGPDQRNGEAEATDIISSGAGRSAASVD